MNFETALDTVDWAKVKMSCELPKSFVNVDEFGRCRSVLQLNRWRCYVYDYGLVVLRDDGAKWEVVAAQAFSASFLGPLECCVYFIPYLRTLSELIKTSESVAHRFSKENSNFTGSWTPNIRTSVLPYSILERFDFQHPDLPNLRAQFKERNLDEAYYMNSQNFVYDLEKDMPCYAVNGRVEASRFYLTEALLGRNDWPEVLGKTLLYVKNVGLERYLEPLSRNLGGFSPQYWIREVLDRLVLEWGTPIKKKLFPRGAVTRQYEDVLVYPSEELLAVDIRLVYKAKTVQAGIKMNFLQPFEASGNFADVCEAMEPILAAYIEDEEAFLNMRGMAAEGWFTARGVDFDLHRSFLTWFKTDKVRIA